MRLKTILFCVVLVIVTQINSQEKLLTSFLVPANLKENANAIIRSNEVNITLNSVSDMVVSQKRIVTVLNKEGNSCIDAYVHYDNNVKIKTLEAIVYNQLGAEIKKIKKNDFKDVSAVDGGTLYSDSRVKYLEYTPVSYPYTIQYICEYSTKNTAFIEPFMPVNEYFLSVENSSYVINFPSDLTVRTKEKQLDGYEISKNNTPTQISYSIKNLEAFKPEAYGPSLIDISPKVLLSSNKFTLEGVQTNVEDWDGFGKWMYQDLIKETHDLPASTVSMIQNLVKNETNDIDKARKVYQYVQDKTRYISVQVGIGGWKPFNASAVDKLGYGDCKGLTNYTMSLLQAAGIPSNYTVVYAGDSQRSLEHDFAAMQGNHVILNIPQENGQDIWLECTSQKLPFGFIGDFTDDRDVLVITPEGGKIKHTKKYETQENSQQIKGNYVVTEDGLITAKAVINSKGIQYDDKYWLETETERDLDTHYKKRWNYVNGITINSMRINNNKTANEFEEDISFVATNYAKKIGDRMLLTVNALNRNNEIPDRYRDRKLPLKIKRGFVDVDEIEIKLPQGFTIESTPEKVTINNKFGSYTAEIEKIDENTIMYKRQFLVNDGEYPKEDYDAYREFFKEVNKQDNAKIALIKNQP